MKAAKALAVHERLRRGALWSLLAADNGPVVLALLKTHLYDDSARTVGASILTERIAQELEALRRRGENWPQAVSAYLAAWVKAGWLDRRFPTGASEEQYELTTAAAQAIRFVSGLAEPRSQATESRLAAVIHQLAQLAEATDPNPESRVASLLRERERIDADIAAVRSGTLKSLPEERALERVREVIALATDLTGDFWRVRDEFQELNRTLRERLIEDGEQRGAILDELFAGVDVIAKSDAGRTFEAFWRLLTDIEQSETLETAIDQILLRDFAKALEVQERSFLRLLTRALLAEGGSVREALLDFARSLKSFVQSRDYQEQRRLSGLLRNALRGALALKETIRPYDSLQFALPLTTSRIRSVSQHALHDPDMQVGDPQMNEAAPADVDLADISDLVTRSEIDFRTLRANIRAVLKRRVQASIGEVMAEYPAHQGFGSVIGYVALGTQHGMREERVERVMWVGEDGVRRGARLPALLFLQERMHEL